MKNKKERELLFSITKKDLTITYFNGTGGGGQNRNKNANCVRIQHPDSGCLVVGQDQKSRAANQKRALHRLVEHPKFKLWLRIESGRIFAFEQECLVEYF